MSSDSSTWKVKHSGAPLDNQTWQTECKTAPLDKVQKTKLWMLQLVVCIPSLIVQWPARFCVATEVLRLARKCSPALTMKYSSVNLSLFLLYCRTWQIQQIGLSTEAWGV